MIKKKDLTACILCGGMRVFSKQWKEKAEGRGSMITHSESVCVDVECQKKVDAKFTEMRERREASEERRKGIVIARRAKSQA